MAKFIGLKTSAKAEEEGIEAQQHAERCKVNHRVAVDEGRVVYLVTTAQAANTTPRAMAPSRSSQRNRVDWRPVSKAVVIRSRMTRKVRLMPYLLVPFVRAGD